jgi:hypothetical protein
VSVVPSRKRKDKPDPEKLCQGGVGVGRHSGEAHEKLFLAGEKDYTCMRCGRYQGCAWCISKPWDLICSHCRDWANLWSLKVHGPMVKDPELKRYGMKLVSLCESGKITEAEFNQLWNTACGLTRDGQKH